MLVFQNRQLKKNLYDDLDFKNINSLLFKIMESMTCSFINTFSLKQFSISLVGVTISTSPLIVALLAWLFLQETMQRFDWFRIVVAFSGAILFVIGKQDSHEQNAASTGAFVGLIINPFLIAGGGIAMRLMKKMHYTVVSTYVSITILVTSGILIVLSG